jgi:hypothetical protein
VLPPNCGFASGIELLVPSPLDAGAFFSLLLLLLLHGHQLEPEFDDESAALTGGEQQAVSATTISTRAKCRMASVPPGAQFEIDK